MPDFTGLIRHLELAPAPGGEHWRLVRQWERSGNPGVRFDPLSSAVDGLLADWKEDDDASQEVCRWTLDVPEAALSDDPRTETPAGWRRRLDELAASRRLRIEDVSTEADLIELDDLVLELAYSLSALDSQGRGAGFFSPSSVVRLFERKLFLADFGFRWDRRVHSLSPPWIREANDPVVLEERAFWDKSPDQLDAMLSDPRKRADLRAHDQRTFVRVVAWLLVGPSRYAEWQKSVPGRVPYSEDAPEIRDKAVWKWIVQVLNASGPPLSWGELVRLVEADRPSTHFRAPPPSPPPPRRPPVWPKALVSAALIGGVVVLLWQIRKWVFPPPPPPLVLCQDCPGTSGLREPLELLAKHWNSEPASTIGLEEEIVLLETAHAVTPSKVPNVAMQERECLAALRHRQDQRVLEFSKSEILAQSGTGSDLCVRIEPLHKLSLRLKALAEGASNSLPSSGSGMAAAPANTSEPESPSCFELLDWHWRMSSCVPSSPSP